MGHGLPVLRSVRFAAEDAALLGTADYQRRPNSAVAELTRWLRVPTVNSLLTSRYRRSRAFSFEFQGWGGWGSNPRPADYESAALTC
jgi:hypothetical protein